MIDKVLKCVIEDHDHDLSIATLLRIVGGLLFCAGIFPAYFASSQPYRAKMDVRGIMGAILGVMANVIQCLALHFFNIFLGGGFKCISFFTRIPGKMIQFDYHIFEMGWFNHQRVSLFLNQEIFGPAPPILLQPMIEIRLLGLLNPGRIRLIQLESWESKGAHHEARPELLTDYIWTASIIIFFWSRVVVFDLKGLPGCCFFQEFDCHQYGSNDLAQLDAQRILHLPCVNFEHGRGGGWMPWSLRMHSWWWCPRSCFDMPWGGSLKVK